MKNQLKHLLTMLLLLPVLSYTGCKEDDDPVNPLELLPPLTNTGKNTFGCLVNGEAFVATSSIDAVAIVQGGGLQVFGSIENKEVDKAISIRLTENPEIKNYIINNTNPGRAEYRNQVTNCSYITDNTAIGLLNIYYLDTNKYIISGTFEFTAVLDKNSEEGCPDTVRVTDGRFDIKYIP